MLRGSRHSPGNTALFLNSERARSTSARCKGAPIGVFPGEERDPGACPRFARGANLPGSDYVTGKSAFRGRARASAERNENCNISCIKRGDSRGREMAQKTAAAMSRGTTYYPGKFHVRGYFLRYFIEFCDPKAFSPTTSAIRACKLAARAAQDWPMSTYFPVKSAIRVRGPGAHLVRRCANRVIRREKTAIRARAPDVRWRLSRADCSIPRGILQSA